MRKTLLITYILVLALTMQGKNEHPVRSALVSQGDSCMAEHDSQHATCIIGNNVKLYQGVTLGAKSFPLDKDGNPIKGIPRHPILEDDVIVYANATILGRITIGKGCVVGANVWVTKDMQPKTKKYKKEKTSLLDIEFYNGTGI